VAGEGDARWQRRQRRRLAGEQESLRCRVGAADDAPVDVALTAGVRAWGTTDVAVDAHAVINMKPVTTAQRRPAPRRLTERLPTPAPSPAFGAGSVSPQAAEYGRQHGVTVIDGGCPCMFNPTADPDHKVMRVMLTLTGNVPRRV
jgi:hypothetical protein